MSKIIKKHIIEIDYGLSKLSKKELYQRARITFLLLASKELLQKSSKKRIKYETK